MTWKCRLFGCKRSIVLMGELVQVPDRNDGIDLSAARDVEICERCYSEIHTAPSYHPYTVPISGVKVPVRVVSPRQEWTATVRLSRFL